MAAPQTSTHSHSRPRCTRRQSSIRPPAHPRARRPRAPGQARQKISARSTSAAPMIMPSAIRKVILRNGSPASSQPMDTKKGCSAQPTSPPSTAGRRCARRPPCPRRRWRRTVERATADARGEPGQPAGGAAAQLAHRALQQGGVGERAQDVGHREAGGEGQPQAVDQHRRVQHADADAEHADAQQVGDQLPGRRLRQPHPHHGLDQHAHAAHAGHRGRRRLDVVGAVLAVDAVAGGHRWSRAGPPAPGRRRRSPARNSCRPRSRRPAARAPACRWRRAAGGRPSCPAPAARPSAVRRVGPSRGVCGPARFRRRRPPSATPWRPRRRGRRESG